MPWLDRLLKLRTDLRKLALGFFRPSVLAAEKSREDLSRSLQTHWPRHPIEVRELIYENWDEKSPDGKPKRRPEPEFIVFIDPELDVDWINEGTCSPEDLENISLAESVGARRCKHLQREHLLEFRRLIGQSIVNGIRGNGKLSRQLAETAAQFLKDRTVERSRGWTMTSAHALMCIVLAIASLWAISNSIQTLLTDIPAGLCFAAIGGLVGVYLSVLQKAGTGEWDASSGGGIHFLEVFTKLAAGTVLGGVSFALSQSVHAPASLKALTPDAASLFAFGLAAGLFERLIPKMISTYAESYINNTETRKGHEKKSSTDRIIEREGPNGASGSPSGRRQLEQLSQE